MQPMRDPGAMTDASNVESQITTPATAHKTKGSRARINLIDFDPDEEPYYTENTTSGSRVSHIHSELKTMTFDKKQQ